jgi:hypothetical protein
MNIKLKDNWVLTKNPNNIILGKVTKRKNKLGEMEDHIQNIGYYTTPFNAVLGYLKYGIRDSSAESFTELEQAYNELIASVSKGVGEWCSEQDKIQTLELENKTLKSKLDLLQHMYDSLRFRLDGLEQ